MANHLEESTESGQPSSLQTDTVTKRKRKRKYSRNLKGAQQFERRVSKSARRISRAVAKGFNTYLEERDKSLSKRRDGALIESYVNVARGVEEAATKASPVVVDLAKAVNSKRTRRFARRVLKAIPVPRMR